MEIFTLLLVNFSLSVIISFLKGFRDWKQSERIGDHERSEEHNQALIPKAS